jgi:N-acyl-L-homoserine lactone synthetase
VKITVRNFPRLDEDGVKAMAQGITDGSRFLYPLRSEFQARDTVAACMWLALGMSFSEAAAKQIGAIVGNMDRVMHTVNGLPMTWAGWIVHHQDWDRVVERLTRIQAAIDD